MTVLAQPRQTAGKLIYLILKRLIPMLLDATDGDVDAARALAMETVSDYPARNNADLIAIAQIIACGLASLGNLSLSMSGNIPHDLILRLQAASNALDRSARMNRRLLSQTPPPPADFYYEPGPGDAALEEAAMAALAESQKAVAQARADHAAANKAAAPADIRGEPGAKDAELQAIVDTAMAESLRHRAQARAEGADAVKAGATTAPETAKPDGAKAPVTAAPETAKPEATTPAPPQPKSAPATQPPAAATQAQDRTVPDLTDQEKAIIWAQGMNRIAAEYTASIPHLPPAQRRQASLRAHALSTTASNLIAGTPSEPFLLPNRPQPGKDAKPSG